MDGRRERARLVTYSRTKRKLPGRESQSIKRRRVVPSNEDSLEREDMTVSLLSGKICSSPPSENLSDIPIFSDEKSPASTPPSSSPDVPDPIMTSWKPIQKTHAQKRGLQQPIRSKQTPPKKPLVQMQLNLGQSFQRRCKTCGMEYVPSSLEDSELHRKYHSQNADGIFVGKDFLKKAEGWRGIEWTGKDGHDRVASISRDRKCQSGRQYITPILNMVQSELGAVDITYNLLWSLCNASLHPDHCHDDQTSEVSDRAASSGRYKVYLYIHDTRCIGLCLAERVAKAYKVVGERETVSDSADIKDEDETTLRKKQRIGQEQGPGETEQDSPLTISETLYDNVMGISRIWVSSGYRKKGIASILLDCAAKTFREEGSTPKNLVAFSQPTQSGAQLARQWFGKAKGWHVYADSRIAMECRKGEWYSRRDDEVLER